MLVDYDIQKLGGIGASEIGKLFTAQGVKAKTAQTLVLEKCEELINGYRKDITTIAMQHGIFNEEEAFNYVVKPCYPNSKLRSNESIWIQDELWATPDVTDESEQLVIDIKCPYSIATYFNNILNIPSTYVAQMQCQLLATGFNNGMICVYLTSNEIDSFGNKIEYDISINERHKFLPIFPDSEFQKEITQRHSEFIKLRDTLMEDLAEATILSDTDFFEIHKTHKITPLKDKHNLFTWGGMIYKNKGRFYVAENKNK